MKTENLIQRQRFNNLECPTRSYLHISIYLCFSAHEDGESTVYRAVIRINQVLIKPNKPHACFNANMKILYIIAKLHLFEFTFVLSSRSTMVVNTAASKLFSAQTFTLKTFYEAHCICTTHGFVGRHFV